MLHFRKWGNKEEKLHVSTAGIPLPYMYRLTGFGQVVYIDMLQHLSRSYWAIDDIWPQGKLCEYDGYI